MEKKIAVELGYEDLVEAVDRYEKLFTQLMNSRISVMESETLNQMWKEISYVIGQYAYPYAIVLEDRKNPVTLRNTTEG